MAPFRPVPQNIISPLTQAAVFLTLTLEEGGEKTCREALAGIAALRNSVGRRRDTDPDSLSCVAGVGSDAWDRLFPGPRPTALHPFTELRGPVHKAPSTPGDLLLHLRADRMDLCFELADEVLARLRPHAKTVDETHGFGYFDSRDLLGFVDGTENPAGEAAATWAYADPEQEPDFPGGSYAIVQKYLHDRDSWNALAVEEQERAVGRTKTDDIELPDDAKPADSHVALNVITDADGNELKIVRRNMPFFNHARGEYGTYFIGYAASPEITEQMLRNMFLGTDDAPHDRLLDFSTAVTGGLFFIPPESFLADQPPIP